MRLLTRSDFDGLICAVLLKEIGLLDDWKFVHPKDVQDGKVEAGQNDILANVPYAPGCGMWFDHHSSEQERHAFDFVFKGASERKPSCARVIWDYFGGHERFPARLDEMMRYVDKCDSGDLTREEIETPEGWVLLSFIMDPRTGLGRYRDYRISNYQLMMELVELCRTAPVADILANPDVRERAARYFEQDALFRQMIKANARAVGKTLVIDLRDQTEIYTGNRFIPYAMFPECDLSIQIIWGREKQNTVITMGHSILNRASKVDVGSLMLKYGGGGHARVGTCQVENERAQDILQEMLDHVENFS